MSKITIKSEKTIQQLYFKKVKRQAMEWEKIFANRVSG